MKAIAKKIRGKLCAVTQDIKSGDKVWDSLEKRYDIAEKERKEKTSSHFTMKKHKEETPFPENYERHCKRWLYKVIGKISPNATWVKDGDEIEIEGGGWILYYSKSNDYRRKGRNKHYKYVKIKCSQCGSYH